MTNTRDKFKSLDLEGVADNMAGSQPGSKNAHEANTEFIYRNAKAQREIADTSKKSITIMMWSVIVLAISSLINLVIEYLG